MSAKVEIRMYNPGFGDCFRVTVRDGDKTWRLLLDCGVHSHGRFKVGDVSRSIDEVAAAVVADLAAETGGTPHLDVVVATHHHADHISGFASDVWDGVDVDEVWVSFVEDPDDPDAIELRDGTAKAADALVAQTDHAVSARGLAADEIPPALGLAMDFAVNSSRNEEAMGRLTAGRFHGDKASVRFLPDKDAAANLIQIGPDARVHVLGPSRDPADIARMNPTADHRWPSEIEPPAPAAAASDEDDAEDEDDQTGPLFDEMYCVPRGQVRKRIGAEVMEARSTLRLDDLAFDDEALLAAASILERSVNNTSVFFVLEVAGHRFVFVGDSQEGAWNHVLDDPDRLALVTKPLFYKVGHHGSHNATPFRFVEGILGDDAYAMVPVGFVKAWADQIPFTPLITEFEKHNTHVVRADKPPAASHEGDVTVSVGPEGMWSELAFDLA